MEFASRFHIEFQGKAYWYLSARIEQDKDYNITIDQSRYAKSIVKLYSDPAGVKKTTKVYTSILPPSFVPTKTDFSPDEGEARKLQEEYNIDYASCIGFLIDLSKTRPDLIYHINKLENTHACQVKNNS